MLGIEEKNLDIHFNKEKLLFTIFAKFFEDTSKIREKFFWDLLEKTKKITPKGEIA
mgnify:CR=1 FL=1